MVRPSSTRARRARWGGLVAIVVLAIISGGWLLRRKAAPDGSVYQQARLFENVVASMQLSGTAGGMQVPGAEMAGVFNMGGAAVTHYVSILERVR